MGKEKAESLYVGVQSPQPIRRALLEGVREILELLKANESFKEIQEQKQKAFEHLRTDVRSLTNHLGKLRGILPSIRAQEPKQAKPKEPEVPKVVEQPKPAKQMKLPLLEKPKHLTEAERIEQELKQIEAELDNLS